MKNKLKSFQRSRCKYCSAFAKGIIYRAKDQLQNVYSCYEHATHLFIPFSHYQKIEHQREYENESDRTCLGFNKQVIQTKKQQQQQQQNVLQQSSFNSPIKQYNQSKVSQYQGDTIKITEQRNMNNQQSSSKPQPTHQTSFLDNFFNNLMSNVISQFNQMRKEVTDNYLKTKNLQNNPETLNFRMKGDLANPYIILNQDDDLLMNVFVNRLMCRHADEQQRKRRDRIRQRRLELSRRISEKGQSSRLTTRMSDLNMINSSYSKAYSPQRKKRSLQKSSYLHHSGGLLSTRQLFQSQVKQKN